MSVNKVILIGRLGADPEVKILENDRYRTTFNVATNEHFKKNGKMETVSDWHHIIGWGKVAEIMSRVKKGHQVYIEGKIKYFAYEKDGVKYTKTQIQVDIFRALSKPVSTKEEWKEGSYGDYDPKDDVPFKEQ